MAENNDRRRRRSMLDRMEEFEHSGALFPEQEVNSDDGLLSQSDDGMFSSDDDDDDDMLLDDGANDDPDDDGIDNAFIVDEEDDDDAPSDEVEGGAITDEDDDIDDLVERGELFGGPSPNGFKPHLLLDPLYEEEQEEQQQGDRSSSSGRRMVEGTSIPSLSNSNAAADAAAAAAMGYEDPDRAAMTQQQRRQQQQQQQSPAPPTASLSSFFQRVTGSSSAAGPAATTTGGSAMAEERIHQQRHQSFKSAQTEEGSTGIKSAHSAPLPVTPAKQSGRRGVLHSPGGGGLLASGGVAARSTPTLGGSGGRQTQRRSLLTTLRTRVSRRSTRRAAGGGGLADLHELPFSGSSKMRTMAEAVGRLELHRTSAAVGGGDSFEAVAAAAAVVAASATPTPKRGLVQFGRGDHVLVMLTLLGMADQEGEKDLYTIDPVNAHGYPQGEGKTDEQKQGPFLFVLCTVMQVHFDEDERYYTVRRCDTGKEQRSDPGYMEPIRSMEAVEVAYKASQRSRSTMADPSNQAVDKLGCCNRIVEVCSDYWVSLLQVVVPWYTRSRNAAKSVVKNLLHGDNGYAWNIRFSGINFLVLCSLIFLFEDVVVMAFFSADWDRPAAILSVTVWIILVLELFFEFLIRPPNYPELVNADKAFAPATARHVNSYHLVCEGLALALFLPQVSCALSGNCAHKPLLNTVTAPLWAITSKSGWKAAIGRFTLGLTFLRAFGLVRHWKQMWINHMFERKDPDGSFVRRLLFVEQRRKPVHRLFLRNKKDDADLTSREEEEDQKHPSAEKETDEDKQLKNAATIGTALMLVNSHRALFLLLFVVSVFPVLNAGLTRNPVAYEQAVLLQNNNLMSNTTDDCDYLQSAVKSWFKSASVAHVDFALNAGENDNVFLQWAILKPIRCDWQTNLDGIITPCSVDETLDSSSSLCDFWDNADEAAMGEAATEFYADINSVRSAGITEISLNETAPADFSDGETSAKFFVQLLFNESNTVALTYSSLFLLLVSMMILGLVGLTVMRSDAERLVLFPLQRMLRIVVRYAENPLSTPSADKRRNRRTRSGIRSRNEGEESEDQLGHYETEQLIGAVAKIADLLRKCWGVAGAGIISSNLAREKDGKTVVFNPTIPGKQVYALFGFIGIQDFSKQLRALEKDVMILVNDVARVVHDEVYRWALGDSGQCNKNLGGAFLMVFRIGDFSEVHDKKKRATDVVFNSQMKNVKVRQRPSHSIKQRRRSSRHFDRGGGTLQLASLPGIQSFTDRAVLGFLKSFAGLHRDQKLQDWQKDFRLGAGVGNFTIKVIYGMDAGWAVEGAVGSEYKIDATYLSPHVNMASRMMSACKQYGVKILLSQAVEELLSKSGRSKLRHLDTVYVKGSNVDQRIYTYDARHEGADFFLFERSPEQADIEADSYTPSIWENDQDLKSMRQHVTDEFMEKHKKGVEQYLEGNWKDAVHTLQEADDLMFEAVLEQGYVDYITEDMGEYGKALNVPNEELARLKEEFGDGACKCLIQYMQRRRCVPPADWHGVRHLLSK